MSLRVSCSHLLCSMFLHTRFTRPSRIRRMIHFPLRTEMFLHARFTRPSRIRRMIHFAPRTKWRANSQREMFLHARFTKTKKNPENDPFRSEHRMKSHAEACQNQRLNGLIVYVCVCVCVSHIYVLYGLHWLMAHGALSHSKDLMRQEWEEVFFFFFFFFFSFF